MDNRTMPLLHTFSQVKNSRIVEIAGVCKTSNEFRQYVNDATEVLMTRGDWPAIVVPVQLCVRNGCLVMPQWAGQIRKLNTCRNNPVFTTNFWFQFIDDQLYRGYCGSPIADRMLTSYGYSPVYQDIPADGSWLIRAYPKRQADTGKTITIYGVDANGQALQHKDANGDWLGGTVIRLQIPYGTTKTAPPYGYVRKIDRVLKEQTQGDVNVYAYRPSDGTQIQLATYGPSEEIPEYSRYQLSGQCCPSAGSTTCNTSNVYSVVALVKLKFVPVNADTDIVLIPSMMALKLAIQSLKYAEAGEPENSAKYMALAVRELGHVLDNETPAEDMPVNSSFRGHECVGWQRIF